MDKQVQIIDQEEQTRRDKQKDVIVEKLGQGIWFKDACVLAGSSEESGHRWKREDDSFESRCEAAIIEYKSKLISAVNLGSLKDARHAFEVLRTRWPDEWNVAKKIEHSGAVSIEITQIANDIQNLIKQGHEEPTTTDNSSQSTG